MTLNYPLMGFHFDYNKVNSVSIPRRVFKYIDSALRHQGFDFLFSGGTKYTHTYELCMSFRVGTGRMEIKSIEPTNKLPIKEEWSGEAEFNNESVRFVSDIDPHKLDSRQLVVYERTDLFGQEIVILHEIVGETKDSTNKNVKLAKG